MSVRVRKPAVLLVGAILLGASVGPAAARQLPRLVLQLTVDALRGDLPDRFDQMLGDGGFQLMKFDGVASAVSSTALRTASLEAASVSRPVTPYDIAPTLATYLGVKPPSGAIGNPLPEVLGARPK